MQADKQYYVKEFDVKLLSDIKFTNNSNVISALQRGNLHKAIDCYGWTLLHYAVHDANSMIVLHLINMGSNVDAQDRYGKTPLLFSLRKDRLLIVHMLLEANANIYITDKQGISPLELVVSDSSPNWNMIKMFFNRVEKDYKDSVEIAQILLDANCSLYNVVSWDKPKVTRYFLETGLFDLNSQSHAMPLHMAVSRHRLENVKLLLENGADVNAKNTVGETPIMFFDWGLSSDDNLEILKLLLSFRVNLCEKVKSRIFKLGTLRIVAIVVEHGIDLLKRDSRGYTPLHYLAENDCKDVLKALKGKEFDVNIRDRIGRTPLHLAACASNSAAIDFLLKNGADINVKDENENTPLLSSITSLNITEYWIKRNEECIEILLQNDAEVESKVFLSMMPPGCNRLFKLILMYLTIREERGIIIAEEVLKTINADIKYKFHFELYKKTLKQMKDVIVSESVTLFKLFTESERKIVRYLRNPYVVTRLLRMNNKCILKNYCVKKLRQRVKKAIEISQLQQHATYAIGRITGLHDGVYSIVSDRIIEYLDADDMKNLIMI